MANIGERWEGLERVMLGSAAELRARIEGELAGRIPSALSQRPAGELKTLATGIAELDAWTGGIPIGGLSEVYGPASSGRTSLVLSLLAGVTREGLAAYIDVTDAFDPESGAAAGVDLARVLWVRCGVSEGASREVKAEEAKSSRSLLKVNMASAQIKSMSIPGAHNSPRRHEAGVQSWLKPGTPSAPNRRMETTTEKHFERFARKLQPPRREQIPTDRLPARRGEYFLAKTREHAGVREEASGGERERGRGEARAGSPWARMEQAIRCADLLIQSGGFALMVLDFGTVEPRFAQRVPLTTWFRFRRAVLDSDSAVVLIGRQPVSQSCASLVLRCGLRRPVWQRMRASSGATGTLLERSQYEVEVERWRKPVRGVRVAEFQAALCAG